MTALGAILALVLSHSIAFATSAPYTDIESPVSNSVRGIVSTIVDNNLSLKEQYASNEAEELEMRAENIIGPTSIEYSPFFRSGVTGLASSELIVKQEFDFPTQYSARSKSINLKRRVMEAELDQQCRLLRIEATQCCIDWIALKKERDVLQQRVNATDTILDLYSRRYDAHSATLLELNKIRLSKQDLEREILENEINASEIEAQLTLLNAGKALNLEGLDYEEDLNSINLPPTVADYVANSPAIKAAEAAVDSSVKEVGIASASWLPTISVGYRRNTEVSEASNGFLIGLDFPIFSAGKRKKAARAKKLASEMELAASINTMETEAETTMSRLQLIKNTIDSYDMNLINQTIGLYSQSLELGQITLTEYYQEIDQLYDRLLTRNRLEHEYRRLAATLIP